MTITADISLGIDNKSKDIRLSDVAKAFRANLAKEEEQEEEI